MKNYHILYIGLVQGVGFRYTVTRFARDLGLTGWVKNLPNGSVEVLAQGPERTLNQLCLNIEQYFDTNITDIKKVELPIEETFVDFKIDF